MLGRGPLSTQAISDGVGVSAITVRATALSGNTSGTTISVPIPTGTTAGDVTFVWCSQNGTGTLTPPTGWTTLYTAPGHVLVYRVFQSGDPASITISSTASAFWSCGSIAYTGLDTSTPVDASNGAQVVSVGSGATNTLAHAPAVNPAWNGGRLVCFYGANQTASGTITLPGALTSRFSSGPGPLICAGDVAITSAASTGSLDATVPSGAAQHAGVQVALKAAGATAATQATSVPIMAGYVTQVAAAGTTHSVNLALAGVSVGDLVLLFVAGGAVTSVTAGYTAVQTGTDGVVYAKTFAGGDSTTPTVTTVSSFYSISAMLFRGSAGGTIKVDTSSVANITASTTNIAGALTPAVANETLISYFSRASLTGATPTMPSGQVFGQTSSFGPSWGWGAVENQSGTTATYTVTWSSSGAGSAFSTLVGLASPNVTVALAGQRSTSKVGTLVGSISVGVAGGVATTRASAPAFGVGSTLAGQHATTRAGALTLQIAITVTGRHATTAAGALTLQSAITVTGRHATTAAGVLAPSAAVTFAGQQTSTQAHAVTPEIQPAFVGGQVITRAGTISVPNNITVTLSGSQITSTRGALAVASAISITGQQAAIRAGSVSPTVEVLAAGRRAVIAAGQVTPAVSATVILTGQQATTAAGTVTPVVRVTVTGQRAAANVGLPVAGTELTPHGTRGTTRAGNVGAMQGQLVALTGEQATVAAGTLGISISSNAALTGNRATIRTGQLVVSISVAAGRASTHSRGGQLAYHPVLGLIGQRGTTRNGRLTSTLAFALAGARVTSKRGTLRLGDLSGPQYLAITAQPQTTAQTDSGDALMVTTPESITQISEENTFVTIQR